LLGTEALAIKQALEQVKLNAKGSEEEREKAWLSVVVVGDISCSVKEKRNSHVGGGANATHKFFFPIMKMLFGQVKGHLQEC